MAKVDPANNVPALGFEFGLAFAPRFSPILIPKEVLGLGPNRDPVPPNVVAVIVGFTGAFWKRLVDGLVPVGLVVGPAKRLGFCGV